MRSANELVEPIAQQDPLHVKGWSEEHKLAFPT